MSGHEQEIFATALLAPEAAVPSPLCTWNGSDVGQRFGIYRNNVLVSLGDALAAKYPIVCQLVGDVFFAAMARAFIACEPPQSPVLAEYGAGFAPFIEAFEPARRLPYLGDVARLEAAWLDAYHSADAIPLAAQAFAAHLAGAPDMLVFGMHPSVRIITARHAVGSLFAAHHGHLAYEDVDPMAAEDVMIVRPHMEVDVIRLAPGMAAFMQALALGRSLGEAVMGALENTPGFSLNDAMALLVNSGVVVCVRTTQGPTS